VRGRGGSWIEKGRIHYGVGRECFPTTLLNWDYVHGEGGGRERGGGDGGEKGGTLLVGGKVTEVIIGTLEKKSRERIGNRGVRGKM